MKEPLVLITRPTGQHTAFAQGCETLGFTVNVLPCLQIQPVAISEQHLHDQLSGSQTVLFTSANAVRLAHDILPLPWIDHKVHAIGAATARALLHAGQQVSLTPLSPYNSEAYLAQLQGLAPESLLIIKGRGGRGLIQPQLEQRGWRVTTLDVYERVKPTISANTIDMLFRVRPPDIISVTSDDILNNLWQLCRAHAQVLNHTPLVVNSQRCADRARQLGSVIEPLIAQPAGDTGQLACLAQWKDQVFANFSQQ